MRKWLQIAAVTYLTVAPVSAQHPRVNPPVDPLQTMEANVPTPKGVSAILQRACYDCHSNVTHWRWYSRVPILSSIISKDVERARRVLNFSEWSDHAGLKPAVAASPLMAGCAAIQVDAATAGLRPACSDHSEKFSTRRARSTSLLMM